MSELGLAEVAELTPTALPAAAATCPAAFETVDEAVLAADLTASVTEALSPCSLDSMCCESGACDDDASPEAAAIEFSPCCASVSRSAAGSAWVSSPLAHLLWRKNCDVRGVLTRDCNKATVVIGRDLVGIDVEEDERTRTAALRRHHLEIC